MIEQSWKARSPYRLPDRLWQASVSRIRAEFEEMPCLRITLADARRLFGLPDPAATWVLRHLARDGFLVRTARGEYMRRAPNP